MPCIHAGLIVFSLMLTPERAYPLERWSDDDFRFLDLASHGREEDRVFGHLPESITTDESGNIYLSMNTTVVKITPSGQQSTFVHLPVPDGSFVTGLKFGEDGHLYATAGTPDPAVAFVWRISPNGQHAELNPNGFPNDLAFDDDLYVTDPFLGQIWKIDDCGDAEVWFKDPLLDPNVENPYLVISPFGVDGIAFDKNLYVGNLDYGRIEIDKHGEPDDDDVFFEKIGGVDGITFDKQENLFLAIHRQDGIDSLDKKAKESITTDDGGNIYLASVEHDMTTANKAALVATAEMPDGKRSFGGMGSLLPC